MKSAAVSQLMWLARMNMLFNTGRYNVAVCIYTQMIFSVIIVFFETWPESSLESCWGGAGYTQFLTDLCHSPMAAITSAKAVRHAGIVLSSKEPNWVLLAGLLPIRMSGHGWRFINSVLLLEFLCCASLLLSDHFQQIYVVGHVKLRKTLTN